MEPRILSYSSMEQLYAKDSIFLNEYADAVHITATATLRKGLVEHNKSTRWLKAPILTFGQLVKYIGNRWFQAETLLKQSIGLTRAYEQYAQEVDNKVLFAAFDKNQQQILSTVRALVEAGATPAQLGNCGIILSDEEEILLSLWKKLSNLSSIRQYNRWFEAFSEHTQTEKMMRDVLVHTVKDTYKEKNKRKGINAVPYVTNPNKYKELEKLYPNEPEKIQDELAYIKANELIQDTFDQKKVLVFHGFYFITPVQQRILNILQHSNIEIVYLIYYDERYPKVFETVRQFLPMERSEQVSRYDIPMNTNALAFAKALHGDFEKMPSLRQTSYTVFQQLYQLKEYVANNEEEKIFSPRAPSMEKYFSSLTTAATAELKDYPIGQFLIDLHRLSKSTYELEQERYMHSDEVDLNILLRLFNSGYLSIPADDGTVVQGKSLVKLLIYLKGRFTKCRTFKDWQTELTYFIYQKQMLEQSLLPKGVVANDENELYIYPHRDISYYNVSTAQLEQILKGICILQSFYEQLYTGTNLSIKQYIEQMESILFKQLSPNLSPEDAEMVKVIMEQIRTLDQQEFEGINRKDIIKGLAFYLSHVNQQDEVTEKVEDGQQANHTKAIGALVDLDGFMFGTSRKLHLAFMDNKALPLAQGFSLWPLREETLDALIKNKFRNTLKQLQIRKEMAGSITAYLLYMGMQKATNIHFSLVKNVENEHHLVGSFYLQLMGLQAVSYKPMQTNTMDEQYEVEHSLQVALQLPNRTSHHIVDQTFAHCQRRFMASYLLQTRPTFTSDFHLRFLYQGLIQYYEALYRKHLNRNNLNQEAKIRIRTIIDNLFPQWTQTRKDLYYRDTQTFSVVKTQVGSESLNTMPRPLSLIGLKKFSSINDTNTYVPSNKKTRSQKCMYCPFQLSCRESLGRIKEDE